MTKIININKMDKSYVRKGRIKEQGNDFLFWSSQPYSVRIAAPEKIKKEYNTWKHVTEKGFQRVCKIIKRTLGRIPEMAALDNSESK